MRYYLSFATERRPKPLVQTFERAEKAEEYLIAFAREYAEEAGDTGIVDQIQAAGVDVNIIMAIMLFEYQVTIVYWGEE